MAFADSYLSGAREYGGVLTPKTTVACERLWDRFEVRRVLQGLGVKLRHPKTLQILEEAPRTKGKIDLGGWAMRANRDYRRRPGENEVAYGRRLWPTREVKPE